MVSCKDCTFYAKSLQPAYSKCLHPENKGDEFEQVAPDFSCGFGDLKIITSVKCHYANGDIITTRFAGTIQKAEKYFLNQTFNIGSVIDNFQKCIWIEKN